MLPGPVADACAAFLDRIDVAVPGLVTGLYLHGGTGFGEWVPGWSDVDFLAVVDHRPDDVEVSVLSGVHLALAADLGALSFSGLHVLPDDLRVDPRTMPTVPMMLNGAFAVGDRHDGLVQWHELARHGVRVRGPEIADLGVWTDQAELLAHTRDNLGTYWHGWAERLAAGAPEDVDDETCTWCVLGVVRLDHLLVTGEMTSKSRAGRWGLGHYPEEFHRVLREGLRIRDGGPEEYVGDLAQRGIDVARLLDHVVTEARRNDQRPPTTTSG